MTAGKLTDSIEGYPSQFYLLVGDILNTKKLHVVLECLRDRIFDSVDCLRSFVIMPLTRSVVEC